MSTVLLSHHCYNKLPQTEGLRTTQTYPLTVLEVGIGFAGLKSKCGQGYVPSVSSRVEFIPCLFQLLEDAIIPCLVTPFQQSYHDDLCFHCHISFSDSLASSYKDPLIILGPLDNPVQSPHLKMLILTTPVNSLLPCKVPYLQFPGIRIWIFRDRRVLFFLPH